ncbi:MAG: YfcC family protein [Candidatus Egerieousia sp.]
MKKRKLTFPNTYAIVFAAILICAVATWFVPGGEYVKGDDGQLSYIRTDSVPQTWQVFTALYKGFEKQAGIIVFILIVGGTLWIINSTKSLDAGISLFLEKAKKAERFAAVRFIGLHNLILVSMIIIFSLFGGIFGMSEECIAFVAISIPLAISLGYDSIVGVGIVYLAAHVGFAGAFLNPFTVGVAQEMAGLQLFSGMGYRIICWSVLTIFLIVFLLIYAARIRKRPEKSPVYDIDNFWRNSVVGNNEPIKRYRNKSSWIAFAIAMGAIVLFSVFYSGDCAIKIGETSHSCPWLLPASAVLFALTSIATLRKSVHFFIVNLLAFTILYLVIGATCFGWYIPEISALFLSLGILGGISSGDGANKIATEFISGAKDIFSAALVVGLASGIVIILQDGKIINTLLHSTESALHEAGRLSSLSIMYGIQTFINLFIPSATAKAAVTMPIMAPFSDIIGLSRQATVLAFQFGDGFTNMITPTSGVLMAVLGIARIPFAKWVKWVWKLILALIAIGFLLLIPTVLLNLQGF